MGKVKPIDCLIIGHNEMDFREYEKEIRKMGTQSGAYRDLDKSILYYNNKPYNFPEIFNLFCCPGEGGNENLKPVGMAEVFSNTVAYLGSYLAARGYTFDSVNYFQSGKEQLAEKLKQENILTIAITTTLYISIFPILELIEFIRNYNKTAKIIIGGPFIANQITVQDPIALNFLLEDSLQADFYVNSSQGEAALVNIIHALNNNLSLEGIENIIYKTVDQYKTNSISRENNRLSQNMIDWELFADGLKEHVVMRTAISCPFLCAFCGFPKHAGKYQTAEIEVIENELNSLKKVKSVKYIHFIDDTFNIPEKRFKNLLKMTITKDYGFKWQSYLRCQYADEEAVKLMKESGCEGVFLGLESGSNLILKNMNKAADIADYYRGIELLKKYGIVTYGNFIIGFPGETDETVKDTVKFIEESGIDFYRVQQWYCDHITPIWGKKDEYDLKGGSFEWSHSTMNSERANDWIDDIFMTVTNSTWVPQYNFDFANLLHLVQRGIDLQQIKNLLTAFNGSVKKKLKDPTKREISSDVIDSLRKCVWDHDKLGKFPAMNKKEKETLGVKFNF